MTTHMTTTTTTTTAATFDKLNRFTAVRAARAKIIYVYFAPLADDGRAHRHTHIYTHLLRLRKTNTIQSWSATRNNVARIATPVRRNRSGDSFIKIHYDCMCYDVYL